MVTSVLPIPRMIGLGLRKAGASGAQLRPGTALCVDQSAQELGAAVAQQVMVKKFHPPWTVGAAGEGIGRSRVNARHLGHADSFDVRKVLPALLECASIRRPDRGNSTRFRQSLPTNSRSGFRWPIGEANAAIRGRRAEQRFFASLRPDAFRREPRK